MSAKSSIIAGFFQRLCVPLRSFCRSVKYNYKYEKTFLYSYHSIPNVCLLFMYATIQVA